jgi:hypothetical protein
MSVAPPTLAGVGRTWRCTGLRWTAEGPVLRWDGGAGSPLAWDRRVAFAVADGGVRTCVGARGHACPVRAAVAERGTGARCGECARLDRSHSVAADTAADDPRPYHVYLAWFGPGMVKAGITALERGSARLLEQGAVCFSWLGTGPLMAARRTEELLRAALGVPDRIAYAGKRAVRSALPVTARQRAAELSGLHARAAGLAGWPETLEREPFEPVDHVRAFGLDRLAGTGPVRTVTRLTAGGTVAGVLLAAAGPDLHLRTDRGVLVLDTRLMTGWELTAAAEPGDGPVSGTGTSGTTVPVGEPVTAAAPAQDGLF